MSKCRAAIKRVGDIVQICGRPSLIGELCSAHYQQMIRDPKAGFKPIRPRGGMEEVKVRVASCTVAGLRERALELGVTFPDVVRAALALFAPNRNGKGYKGKARNQ